MSDTGTTDDGSTNGTGRRRLLQLIGSGPIAYPLVGQVSGEQANGQIEIITDRYKGEPVATETVQKNGTIW